MTGWTTTEIHRRLVRQRSVDDAGGTVGRDVGRDEGRDQAVWRELVARLELPTPVDPADTPWPERENLRTKHAQTPSGPPGADQAGGESEAKAGGDTSEGSSQNSSSPRHGQATTPDRSRVIRPAGPGKFLGSANDPASDPLLESAPDGTSPEAPPSPDSTTSSSVQTGFADAGPGTIAGPVTGPVVGPRDYAVDEDADFFDDEDLRYVPPPLPPEPRLDPVAKGAWIALFGGPGYLLLATILGWQLAGWTELVSVIAFIAGFVVLVFRLGDGPSKKDGPDQGAVV
jgi:hypothetical protein